MKRLTQMIQLRPWKQFTQIMQMTRLTQMMQLQSCRVCLCNCCIFLSSYILVFRLLTYVFVFLLLAIANACGLTGRVHGIF